MCAHVSGPVRFEPCMVTRSTFLQADTTVGMPPGTRDQIRARQTLERSSSGHKLLRFSRALLLWRSSLLCHGCDDKSFNSSPVHQAITRTHLPHHHMGHDSICHIDRLWVRYCWNLPVQPHLQGLESRCSGHLLQPSSALHEQRWPEHRPGCNYLLSAGPDAVDATPPENSAARPDSRFHCRRIRRHHGNHTPKFTQARLGLKGSHL
jgi:hypothetical protein